MTPNEHKLWSALRELSVACAVTRAASTRPQKTDPHWLQDAMTAAEKVWREREAEGVIGPVEPKGADFDLRELNIIERALAAYWDGLLTQRDAYKIQPQPDEQGFITMDFDPTPKFRDEVSRRLYEETDEKAKEAKRLWDRVRSIVETAETEARHRTDPFGNYIP